MRKAPGQGGRGKTPPADGDTTLAPDNPCPYSLECRRHWTERPPRTDGVLCGLCLNWLTRTILIRQLFRHAPT